MISARLQELLTALSWSQTRLAEEAKTHPPTVNRWITGKTKPSRRTLARIAEITGCSLGWLQDGKGEMFGLPAWVSDDTADDTAKNGTKNDDNLEHLPPEWLGPSRRNRISNLLTRAAIVLESSDAHRIALAATINALYKAIETEKELTELKRE